MKKNNITEPTAAELNEFIEAYQNATPEAQAEAAAMLRAAAVPAEDTDDETDEARGFMLQAFEYAMENSMNDETKAEAKALCTMFFGKECSDSSPAFALMSGFIMGMGEGMRVAETLDRIAAEQQQSEAQ